MAGVSLEYDQITSQGIFEQSSTQKHRLGEYRDVGECRYRYSKAVEALVLGNLVSAYDSGNVALTAASSAVTTAVVGATTISILSTGATLDNYKDWYLLFNDSTGEGQKHKIKSNTARAGASSSSTLTLYDPIRTATLRGSTAGDIIPNKYVVQKLNAADPVVEVPIGVAPLAVTKDYYFWAQTKGYAAQRAGSGGVAIGKLVQPSMATDGFVEAYYQQTSSINNSCIVGRCVVTAAVGVWSVTDLTLE